MRLSIRDLKLPKLVRAPKGSPRALEEPRSLTMKLASFADYVPIVALIFGFLLIGVAWNGAASVDYTQGQIPYLISGGLVGLGLVFFASAAFVVQAIKKGQARQNDELASLNQTLERLASTMSFSANGHSDSAELYVAGSSSFHLPTCRTVGNRQGLVKVTRSEAEAEGLEPCRICNP